jgi:hypothetical protein
MNREDAVIQTQSLLALKVDYCQNEGFWFDWVASGVLGPFLIAAFVSRPVIDRTKNYDQTILTYYI